MTTAQRLVYAYLAPADNSFWKWSEDGTVVTWSNGKTIAFREELHALVTHLASSTLPPLGAILLFRAACRDDWKHSIVEQGNLANFFVLEERQSQSDPTRVQPLGSSSALTQLAVTVFQRLDALADLPIDLRKGLPALCELADAFFENCSAGIPTEVAESVAIEFANGIVTETLDDFRADNAFEEAVTALRAIASGAGVPSTQSLALRAKTGLTAEPAPAEIPVPEAVRRLVSGLSGDAEFAGLAKLARDLLAAVSVPRTLRPSSDLPLGGFSDITNRGNLDRLLTTELAHDDLTLAVRIATNEALYMRRETPPAHRPERRVLLIDAGIRMWGVPRVFAAAAAMAFAAIADSAVDIIAYRPAGAHLQTVNLATRDGLVDHLAALECAPHPAPALVQFYNALISENEATTDGIIITHESVFADPEFRRHLAGQENAQLLVATVARDGMNGRFRLHQISLAGHRLLSEATLSLETILHDSPRPLLTADSTSLPVILSLPMLPLQLPYPFMPSRAATFPGQGLLMVSHNGRLLLWEKAGVCPREITHNLPGGRLLGLLPSFAGCAYVVIRANHGPVTAHGVDCRTGKTGTTLSFPNSSSNATAAGLFGTTLFVGDPYGINGVNVISAAALSPISLPGVEWISGRIFRSGKRFLMLTSGGGDLKLEEICESEAVYAFRSSKTKTTYLVFNDGRVTCVPDASNDGLIVATAGVPMPGFSVAGISFDGARLAAVSERKVFELNLDDPAVVGRWKPGTTINAVRFGTMDGWPKNFSLRKNFHNVRVTPEGEIILCSAKGRAVAISVEHNILTMTERTGPLPAGIATAFEAWPEISRSFDLKIARTSCANFFLDSRGMLHVIPRDAAIPQMTFVLHVGKTAAWTLSGITVGPPHFHPGVPTGSAQEIAALLKILAEGVR